MRHYVIYKNPQDLPPGFAVREWTIETLPVTTPVAGPLLASGLATLDEARDALPYWADACIHRSHEDDPSIVESWI